MELIDLLAELEIYFDKSADADFEDGEYRPNQEMILLTEVQEQIKILENASINKKLCN